jgi:hypothetical protein
MAGLLGVFADNCARLRHSLLFIRSDGPGLFFFHHLVAFPEISICANGLGHQLLFRLFDLLFFRFNHSVQKLPADGLSNLLDHWLGFVMIAGAKHLGFADFADFSHAFY